MEEGFLNAFQRRYGGRSKKWKNWIAQLDLKTCLECRKMHGKIYVANEKIGGDIYANRNNHLPISPGRVWYEADINYTGGFRGTSRLVYSNDGLIFATYDHYKTFVEIV